MRLLLLLLGAINFSAVLMAQPLDPEAVLLYEEDFESGVLGDEWVIDGGGDSRARILTIDGSQQLVLDDSTGDDQFSQARATLIKSGGDYGAFHISFEATNHNDEFQVSAQGLDLVDFLVSYSPAATFRLHDYLPLEGNKVRIEYEVKVPGAYSSSFGFRLWQYGSKPYPNDGWSFDNLTVYGLPPRVDEIDLQPVSDAAFDLDFRKPAVPGWPISIGNDEYLVSGDFDRVNGEPSDSVAILDAEGAFRSIGKDLGLRAVSLLDAVRNTDGSLTILIRYLGETNGDRIAVVSQSGTLLSLTEPFAGGIVLLPDDRFATIELGTYENGLGYLRDRFRLRFKHRESNGTITTEAFASDWVTGTFWSLHRLADGSFLAMGDLYDVNETKRGQLARFGSNGELNSDFGHYGYLSEDGNSYDREVYSLPSGELFLYNRYGSEGLQKIRSNGTVDTSFSLDESLDEGWSMSITPGPDGTVYLFGALASGGNSHPSLYRLNPDGSLDPNFDFSGDAVSTQFGGFFWSPKESGGGFVISDSDAMGIGLFDVGANGSSQYREASPFSKLVQPELSWLPTGEILLRHFGQEGEDSISIARADGSLRVEGVEVEDNRGLLALFGGGFVTSGGERFDESLISLNPLVLPSFTEIVEVLPDGGFLARWQEDRYGAGEAFVKLRADGSLDSDFSKLPKRSQFLDINRDFIYYTTGDDFGGTGDTLHRISLDGVEDEDFAFVPEGVSLSTLVATKTHLFFARDDNQPGTILKNWRGIKMSFDGVVDESYDPNSSFSLGGGVYSVFLADGSSIQSGPLEGEVDPQDSDALYYVDPDGAVSPLDPSVHWESPTVHVLEDFDILVSGSAYTANSGLVQMTKRYRRDLVGFSVPRMSYVAWPENEDIVVDASVYSTEGAKLQWLKNGVPMEGRTQAQLAVPAGTLGSFELEVKVDEEVRLGPLVQVLPARKPEFTMVPQSSKALFGSSVELEGRVDLSLEPELQWYLNDVALLGETSPYLTLPDLGVASLGSYKLRARNAVGDSWSQVAYVTGEGPIPAVQAQIELLKRSDLPAEKIIPRSDGAAWVVHEDYEYNPYLSSFSNYRLVKVNGDVEEDFLGKVEMAGGERLIVCPLSGTPYLVSVEPRNNEGIKRHSIKRLGLDGEIDEGFASLVVDGEWSAEVELWRRSDGVLLIRVGQEAFARQLDGSLGSYPLDDLENFLRRFERRSINWGQEFLGMWADGAELELFPDNQELRAKASDGSPLWTFPLGDFYMTSVFLEDFGLIGFEYSRARTNEAGDRIYVRIHESSASGSPYRIAWFEKDGSNNLAEAASWPGELHCQSLSLSSSGDVFVGGLETIGSGGRRIFALRAMREGELPGESIRQFIQTPVQTVELHGSGSDDWLYLSHDGDALADGLSVGPLVRIDGTGEFDRSFQTGGSIPAGSVIESVSTLPNGGVVLVTSLAGQYRVRVLSSEGGVLSDVSLADASLLPEVASGADGSWFMLETSTATRLLRGYDSSGAVDVGFAEASLGSSSHLVGVDSLKRPYYTDTDGNGLTRVLRRTAAGIGDEAYSIDTGESTLRLLVALDRENRVLRLKLSEAGDLVLERFLEDGSLDQSFNSVLVDQEQVDSLRPLFGGYVLIGDTVYTDIGERVFSLGDYTASWRQTYGAQETFGGFANSRVLSALNGVSVAKWFLTTGLDLRYSTRYLSWDEFNKGTLSVDLGNLSGLPIRWTVNGQAIPNESSGSLEISSPVRGRENRYEAFLDLGGSEIRLLDLQVEGNWPPLISISFGEGGIEALWPWDEQDQWGLQLYSKQEGWLNVGPERWRNLGGQRSVEFSDSELEMPLLVRLRYLE